jgi:hypothetical protein
MSKKEKPIPATVCCPDCHHAAFRQTEIRKITVVIINGEAVRSVRAKGTSHALYHCNKCGTHLPLELAKRIKFRSQFSEERN